MEILNPLPFNTDGSTVLVPDGEAPNTIVTDPTQLPPSAIEQPEHSIGLFGQSEITPVTLELESNNLFSGQLQHTETSNDLQDTNQIDLVTGGSFTVNSEAVASLSNTGTGLKGEYFDNSDFTNLILTRLDPTVNFNWKRNSPDEVIDADTFSVRWSGRVEPLYTETYTFSTQTDDGVRLWVDGELLVDAWFPQKVTEHSGTINLEAGQQYDLVLEYYERDGKAVSKLLWSSPNQTQEIIPSEQLYPHRIVPPDDRERLLLITDRFYNPTDTISALGKAYTGNDPSTITKIDFQLQLNNQQWIDIEDATEFTFDSNDPGYAFFNYQLNDLTPGKYNLRAVAYDSQGNIASNTITERFTVLSVPTGEELSERVMWAIARSVNLDNYDSDALLATEQWVVSIQTGQSPQLLSNSLGAVNLGETGYIPNTYLWEFAEETDPEEIAEQLNSQIGIEFAYPLVEVPVIWHSPADEPLVQDGSQWHLRSGESPDANITQVWENDVLGRDVVIGVADNGFEIDDPERNLLAHPDLLPNYRADLSYDFDEDDSYPSRLVKDTVYYEGQGEIKDRKFPQYFELSVPFSGGFVNELKVELEIEHPEIQDLSVLLISPSDDELTLEVDDYNEEGNAEYELDLTSTLKDKKVDGTWKLKITDKAPKDGIIGRLESWAIELETSNYHGTSVAGVAAAFGDNGIGGSGVAPLAEWAGLRMGSTGTNSQEVADVFSHKNQEIDIYNNSWGLGLFQVFPDAEAQLKNLGEGRGGLGNVYVFAGGNGNDRLPDSNVIYSNVNYNSLANSRHTIAVAAIDKQGKHAWYSEPGAPLLVSAYSSRELEGGLEGDGITTTAHYSNDSNDENDYTHTFGGTSASAPFVSGVIALMLESNPNLTWRDVQHILAETAQKNDPNDSDWQENGAGYHVNHKYGFGAIDADAAVELARNWTPVGEEVSVSNGAYVGWEIPIYNPNDPLASTITINPEDDLTIEWIEVEFDATHRYLGDLEIVLISPDGTESILTERNLNGAYAKPGNNSYDWRLTSARHWGESAVGEWTLLVSDKDERNPSTPFVQNYWESWELQIFGTEPTSVNNPPTLTSIPPLSGASQFSPFTISYEQLRGNAADVDGDRLSLQVQQLASGTLFKDGERVLGDILLAEGEEIIWIPDTVGDAVPAFAVKAFDGSEYAEPAVEVAIAVDATAIPNNAWIQQLGTSGIDAGNAVTVDALGNVYVAGSTTGDLNGANGGTDAVISKYDADGNLDWTQQLGSLGNDVPESLAVDVLGNVYLVGHTTGDLAGNNPGGGFYNTDAWIAKYDANGNLDWTQQLEIEGDDLFYDVAIASSGNLHISGHTWSDWGGANAGHSDALMVEYDPKGNLIDKQQLGTELADTAKGIVVDGDGNRYLTGVRAIPNFSDPENPNSLDVWIAKYDAEGNQLWIDELGVSGEGDAAWDNVNAIAIDSEGNAYITGFTSGDLVNNTPIGGSDIFVAKYNSNGIREWVRQLGTPGSGEHALSVAVDNAGNVRVSGFTDGNLDGEINAGGLDAFLVTWDGNGTKLSTKLVGTTADDYANGVAVDRAGNVYLTGYSEGVLGEENAGSQDLWVSKNFGQLTENNPSELALEWIQLSGSPEIDSSFNVAVDSEGNVYTSGETSGSLDGANAGGSDIWVSKYDNSGNLLWTEQLGTPWDERSESMTVDREGNIYLAGWSYGNLGNGEARSSDISGWVAKYDRDGNQLWIEGLGVVTAIYDIAVDGSGNTYVVGENTYGNREVDGFILKYDSNGTRQWGKLFHTDKLDISRGVAVDNSGNIYMSGWTQSQFDRNSLWPTKAGEVNAWVVKYDSNGDEQWTQLLASGTDDRATDVAVDSAGNVYTTGYTKGDLGATNAGAWDVWISKYDSSGNLLWTQQLASERDETSWGVEVDSQNNIYLTGYTTGDLETTNAGGLDAWISKYDSSGNLLWIDQLASDVNDVSWGLAIDEANNAYISGYTFGDLGGSNNSGLADAWVAKYSYSL